MSGVQALDTGITDLVVLNTGSILTLFSHSGLNGGLAGYSVPASGSGTVVDQAIYNTGWIGGTGEAIAITEAPGGGLEALFGSALSGRMSGYGVNSDGQIGGVTNHAGLGTELGRLVDIEVGAGGVAFTDASGQFGFATRAADGSLGTVTLFPDDASTHLAHVTTVATATVGGAQIVIAGDAGEDGVTSFVTTSGMPVVADVAGPADGIGIMAPTDISVVEVLGQSFAIVASAQGMNGALTVFHVAPDGTLTRTDHITDNLNTRFGGVTDIATVTHEGRVYLAVGGADDGVSLFTLLPGGQLQFLDAIENTWTDGSPGQAALADVTAIAGGVLEDTLDLFVASEEVGGLTRLTHDLGDQGIQTLLGAGGGSANGTAGDDILVSGEASDTLSGGNGDDILVDGGGTDIMTGGYGSDTFVLRDDGAQDTIMDFDPAVDRLDLSSWSFFYDPSVLTITPNANGALVTWRDEVLILRSAQGGLLDAGDVRNAVSVTADRAMDLSGYDFPDWDGALEEEPEPVFGYDIADTAGDDLVTGGVGSEMIALSTGDDEVHAGGGNDRVDGGAGRKTIHLDAGDDTFDDKDQSTALDGDIVRGGAGNDTLIMGLGADDVDGGTGRDLIRAGGGDDTVTGGTGADEAWLGAGDDTYTDSDDESRWDHDIVYGEDGDDAITTGNGDDQIDGGAGNDRLGGRAGQDIIFGGAGADLIWGALGNDLLRGDDGDDELYGGSGNDHMLGGAGNDLMEGGYGDDVGHGEDGDDTIRGQEGDDHFIGDGGHDRLFGDAGADRLLGGEGDDRLDGGDGSDTLFGDAGADLITGGSQEDDIQGGDGDDRLYGNLHNDTMSGGAGNDALFGGWGGDRLSGDLGDDFVNGDGGDDTIFGGEGNDRLSGNGHSDWIDGGAGDDEIFGGWGWDTLKGGAGADAIRGESGNDRLWGGGGHDRMFGNLHNDWMSGGMGRDVMFGGWGRDTLKGGWHADVLKGEGGDDTLFGDGHDDRLIGGSGNDSLLGGDGHDVLYGNLHNDWMSGGMGRDEMFGGWGRDTLKGGWHADVLKGDGGDDRLFGDGHDDVLNGGRGNDRLWGGSGADSFEFGRWDGRDKVFDFSMTDQVVLNGVSRSMVSVFTKGGSTFIEWGNEQVELVDFTNRGFDKWDIVYD
jgi:Ca2+-binding RTX toxin-like protein